MTEEYYDNRKKALFDLLIEVDDTIQFGSKTKQNILYLISTDSLIHAAYNEYMRDETSTPIKFLMTCVKLLHSSKERLEKDFENYLMSGPPPVIILKKDFNLLKI